MDDFTPLFTWPGGHRNALSVLVHVPGFGFSEAGTSQEDLIGLDYTSHGLRHLLQLFDDLDIKATIAFTAESVVDTPDLVKESFDRGHEVAASICSPVGTHGDLLPNLRDLTGERVRGLVARLPNFPANELDDPWGDDSGRAWEMDGRNCDLPLLQRDPDAALMPMSPYLMDLTWLSPARPLPPSSLLETWMQTLEAQRELGSYMPVIVHPHVMGRPGFLATLRRFLDTAIAYGDVWIARIDHIAATWHAYEPDGERE